MGEMDICLRWECPACGMRMRTDIELIREHKTTGQCQAMQKARLAWRKKAEIESERLLRGVRQERLISAVERLAATPPKPSPVAFWLAVCATLLAMAAIWYR